MPEAKVFLVIHDVTLRRTIELFLARSGHRIALEASTLATTLKNLESAKEKEINVAVIEESLHFGSADGPRIAKLLRELIPKVKIVSFSPFQNKEKWADAHVSKPAEVSLIGQTIANLIRQEGGEE